MIKCKKHKIAILPCNKDHYEDECDCIQCPICLRVQNKQYKKTLSKSNWVAVLGGDQMYPEYRAFLYKPRHRLKKGDYATLDMKTGYLIKAKGLDVRFLVIN